MVSVENILSRVPTTTLSQALSRSSDVVLVMDSRGTILEIGGDLKQSANDECKNWIGQEWQETVTVESRGKIRSLLDNAQGRAVGAQTARVWRQVNHPLTNGSDLPIRYITLNVSMSAEELGIDAPARTTKRKTKKQKRVTAKSSDESHVIAIGQDLSTVAALQQQLIGAQQSLEREYAKMMQMESRFRLLFSISNEAVLMVSADNLEIVESNPVATRLLAEFAAPVVGRKFPLGFERTSTALVRKSIAQVISTGIAEEIAVRFKSTERTTTLTLTPVTQEGTKSVIVRYMLRDGLEDKDQLQSVDLNGLPDGYVVTDHSGTLISANEAFLKLVEANNPDVVTGTHLEDWLGRTGVEIDIMLKTIRAHGEVKLFASTLRAQSGRQTNVEISARRDPARSENVILSVRDVDRRFTESESNPKGPGTMAKSASELTQLVGQVKLKDLVRESTDLVEKLCIEAALELTDNNRASAAEALGVSRQSLYTKMRRFGLGREDDET